MNERLAVKNGVKLQTYRSRIYRGWSHERAVKPKQPLEYAVYRGDTFIMINNAMKIKNSFNLGDSQFKATVANSTPKQLEKTKNIHDRLIIQRLE